MKYLFFLFFFPLTGCITVEGVPITELRVMHVTGSIVVDGKIYYEGACSVRKVTDKKSLASVRDHVGGLGECNGAWGITGEEFAATREYLKQGN